MKYYIDITIIQHSDISVGFIWTKLYQQIHLALVDNKNLDNLSEIGASFPGYGNNDFPLGYKLRLFSEDKTKLENLKLHDWLKRLDDYIILNTIKETPKNINKYATFSRKQFKSNLLKEAKRRSKYKNEKIEDSLMYFNKYKTKCDLPFIRSNSISTKGDVEKSFKLFIKKTESHEKRNGTFNCYGLSKEATLPIFT